MTDVISDEMACLVKTYILHYLSNALGDLYNIDYCIERFPEHKEQLLEMVQIIISDKRMEVKAMKNDIILIGPVGAGKSTIGKLLSEYLKMPQASLDDERWLIYKEIGYDFEYADQLMEEEGFMGLYKYWKPFEAHSVERVLELYPSHIHDFGAGQSVYEDEVLFKRVEEMLKPYPNIVLLLQSKDKVKSLDILFERSKFPFNEIFLDSPSNEKLAKFVVYTEDKTPEETCKEIINNLVLK